jgi:hypothetical protein
MKLLTDATLKAEFKEISLINLWADISREYEQLSDMVLKFLLPFTNTEPIERAFSYTFIKNKYCSKLNAVPDLRLYLTLFEPGLKKYMPQNKLKDHTKHWLCMKYLLYVI